MCRVLQNVSGIHTRRPQWPSTGVSLPHEENGYLDAGWFCTCTTDGGIRAHGRRNTRTNRATSFATPGIATADCTSKRTGHFRHCKFSKRRDVFSFVSKSAAQHARERCGKITALPPEYRRLYVRRNHRI